MKEKKIKDDRFYRSATVARGAIDAEARTVDLAFSSEAEIERYFGIEILSHDKDAIDLERLKNAAPLLVDHDPTDQVGVIEEVWIGADRMGRARVRFGKSARAEEVFQDVVDGIRQLVSTTYAIKELKLTEEHDDARDVYTVTRWEPLEISIVSIPADVSVGVGRSDELANGEQTIPISGEQRKITVSNKPEVTPAPTPALEPAPAPAVAVDVDKVRAEAADVERKRQNDIRDLGEKIGDTELARQFCDNGKTVSDFIEALRSRQQATPTPATPNPEDAMVGLTKKEARAYSFVKAIRALAFPNDKDHQEAAAFELEVSRAVAKQRGNDPRGILIPFDAVSARASDMVVGTDGDGGYLRGTDHRADAFIELLRNKTVLAQAGMTMMPGLTGNVAIPAQDGAATVDWLAEDGSVTASNLTVAQKTLVPHTISAATVISRRLLLQSAPAAEALVRDDLASVLAIGIDFAGLHGDSGSDADQPDGVEKTTSVGSVTCTALGWDTIVELETDVAVANADVGAMAYITNPKIRGKLKNVFLNSTAPVPVWQPGDHPLNGYRALVSNQVLATYDTNAESAIFFGNWKDLVLGLWGTGLDLIVDPYSGSSTGALKLVAFQDVDFAVRHPGSFSVCVDAPH